MISEKAYLIILIFSVLALVVLVTVLILLLQKKIERNITETFKKILPLVSPTLDRFLIGVSTSGEIFFANDYALKFLKTDSGKLQGTDIESIFVSQQDAQKLISTEPGKSIKIQTNFISKDKEAISVQLDAFSLKLFGQHIGYIIIASDIRVKEIDELNEQIKKYTKIIINQQKSQEEYINKIKKLDITIKNVFKKSGVDRPQVSPLISATKNGIFKNIAGELHDFFDSYLTTCWITEGEEDKLKLLAQFGLSESGINRFEKDIPTGDKILKSLEQKRVITEDISSVQNSLRALLAEEGVHMIAEVPFFSGEKTDGIIEFYLKSNNDLEINKQLFNYISIMLTAINNVIAIKMDFSEELQKINDNKKEIELRYFKKVESCERDLKQMNELQQLTIGRELNMFKLKGEIEELRTQLSSCESKNKS